MQSYFVFLTQATKPLPLSSAKSAIIFEAVQPAKPGCHSGAARALRTENCNMTSSCFASSVDAEQWMLL